MPARFDDAIPFSGDMVVAVGPEHPKEGIEALDVWIYQALPDGAGDAAANGRNMQFAEVRGRRWVLPVRQIGVNGFRPGRAYAIAVALVVEEEDGKQKEEVYYWAQAVELQEDASLVGRTMATMETVIEQPDAVEALLGEGGPLENPLEFKGI
jgi:hypothetical protein